jgi:hypothetical protein
VDGRAGQNSSANRLGVNIAHAKGIARAPCPECRSLQLELHEASLAKSAALSRIAELQVRLQAAELKSDLSLRVRLTAAEARAADFQAQLAAVLASSSWRITRPIRTLLGNHSGIARLVRRGAKFAWWTVTLQLPQRLALRRRALAAISPGAPTPPIAIGAPTSMKPRDLTGSNTAPASPTAQLAALEKGLEETAGSLAALGRQVAVLASIQELERFRLDWALGSLEGVPADIAAYHACRETPEYNAAFGEAEPLVSVCVATMDRADLLLGRAIASLRAQSYRNLQILVVGDNCTDDTAQRLAAVGDNRIQFVNLPERGPYPRPGQDRWRVAGSNAMNHALSLCRGQFVTHLDDDDAMVPHRIELLVAAALREQADFLWHPFWYETPDGTWQRLGDGRFEVGQMSTGSLFYHRYFARFLWDVQAFRMREPGDWNRLRKIRLLRPRVKFVDEPLLYHHAEQSQVAFVARDQERFLE